jgi:hypothetical protein
MGYQGSTSALWDAITAQFPPVCPCPADLNNDRSVDDADFVLFSAAYELLVCPTSGSCGADMNVDGFVDDADFVLFAAAYEQLLCP